MYVLALVTVMIIVTQTINSWFVFDYFSKIKNKKLKNFQSIMFCSIISLFILTTVFLGRHKLALAGAVFEMIMNIYYYAQDFWENGYKSFTGDKDEVKDKRRRSTLVFWRKYWFKILLALVIPIMIFGCSYLMQEVRA